MSVPIELGLFHGDADGECHRCHQMYEIAAYAAFHDDEWTCPDCAGLISPGMDSIIRGLDLVYDGVTLDLFTRRALLGDVDTVTSSLRRLADLIDDIATGKAQLQLSVRVIEGFAPHEEGQPIGVSIDRTITTSAIKELTP